MNALDQVQELVSLASPSHVSNREISDYIARRLDGLGFDFERVEYQDASSITKVNINMPSPMVVNIVSIIDFL